MFPFARIGVNIGQPFTLPSIEGRPSHEVLQSMADMMMSRIATLLPEKYRGVYTLPPPSQQEEPNAGATQSDGSRGTITG
jgi:hypothetical protein